MKLISIDIETWGTKPGYTLQPWQMRSGEAGIMSIAMSDGTQDLVADSDQLEKVTLELPSFLNNILRNDFTAIICGWNLKFDLAFLLQKFPIFKKFKFLDGMLLLKRIKQDLPSYALKKTLILFKEFLPKEIILDYSKDIEFKIGKPSEAYSRQELQDMYEYNLRDAIYTYNLIKYLLTITSHKDKLQTIRESTICVSVASAWANGIDLDPEIILEQETKLIEDLSKIDSVLGKIGLTKKIICSPKQLANYLINKANIELTEYTDKGALSTDRNVLKNLSYKYSDERNRILRLILKRKTLETELVKFVESAKDCVAHYGSKAYPEPMLNSTYTGRVTYSIYHNIKVKKQLKNNSERDVNKKIHIGVPIHQMKRGKIRNLLVAPKGYDIVEFDFAAQEVRLITCIANECTMIELFNNNKDLHSYTAAGIAGMEYDEFLELKQTSPDKFKEMRFLGKVTNLALQYRLGANGLHRYWHDNAGIRNKTLSDATFAREMYLKLYRGIPNYWSETVRKARLNGFVENLAGRKIFLNQWSERECWKSEQKAINFPIQSSGADQKVLGLYELQKNILSIDTDIKFAWDLHDGLYFYIPECEMQFELICQMTDILNNLHYSTAWGWNPQVKFPVEVKVGKRWGELKTLNLELK
jgi:DNA polymerase-1